MSEISINNRFRLLCPEGFREMTEEEREKRDLPADSNTLCLIDEGDSMLASIGWKDVGIVSSLLLYIIQPVASMEASVHQAMTGYGYRKETMLERSIGGRPAKGFRFTYTAGAPMVGESYVIREGRSLTFFHVYLKADLQDETLARWNRLLDAVQAV